MADDEIWVPSAFPKAKARGFVRLQPDGEDWVVTALILTGDEINSQTLKAIPLGAIAIGMRTDKNLAADLRSKQIRATRGLSDMLSTAMESWDPVAPRDDNWEPPARDRLTRPDRTDPDGHSRAVAAAYNEAVRLGKSPGPAIATEANVPVATAHGWIREARRRGFLPKGRKGRAG